MISLSALHDNLQNFKKVEIPHSTEYHEALGGLLQDFLNHIEALSAGLEVAYCCLNEYEGNGLDEQFFRDEAEGPPTT